MTLQHRTAFPNPGWPQKLAGAVLGGSEAVLHGEAEGVFPSAPPQACSLQVGTRTEPSSSVIAQAKRG